MEMDKRPPSVSMKDFLIRVLAVKMMKSEKTIEAIINHQFQTSAQAIRETKSVEISGFGKFFFNDVKARKKMELFLKKKALYESLVNNPELSETRRKSAQNKLANTIADIEFLKPRIDDGELFTNNGGLEKPADSPIRHEGSNSQSE